MDIKNILLSMDIITPPPNMCLAGYSLTTLGKAINLIPEAIVFGVILMGLCLTWYYTYNDNFD